MGQNKAYAERERKSRCDKLLKTGNTTFLCFSKQKSWLRNKNWIAGEKKALKREEERGR